jgi:hypothetical protein
MATGLVVLWIFVGGLLMRRYRSSIRSIVLGLRGPWELKFALFSTILAMIEEAVTTTMTNLAPVFGVPIGKAYITASSNYLVVICFHSVIVIAPMFVGWMWMLRRWNFHPNAVFLLFGLTGTLAEVSFGGVAHFAEYGMWTFVYGLMIYLPAFCLPDSRAAKPPSWWAYPVAVLLPFLFAAPVAAFMGIVFHHPRIEFPPN